MAPFTSSVCEADEDAKSSICDAKDSVDDKN